jgi:iron complex transport system substrate-binding protein
MFFVLLILLLFPLTADGYERIISLSPQITESIYLLGAGERLTAVTTFCKRPADALGKEKVGTPLRPDTEKIVLLKPDLVLGSREGNPPWAMERLRRLGVNARYLPRPRTAQELFENFLLLSRLLGTEGKAKAILRDVGQGLEAMRHKGTARVLWQVGAEPLIVASTASFANDIIKVSGGVNAIAAEMPYPRINVEEVVLKPPQLIVLTDMGYNVDMEMARWHSLLGKVRFVTMDPYVLGSPTPVTFLDAARKLRQAVEDRQKQGAGS